MRKFNSWGVTDSGIRFIESALRCHPKVAHLIREHDILFRIERSDHLSQITALLVNIYVIGLSDYYRARQEFPNVNCLVTSGQWNMYTDPAKEQSLADQVGLFKPSEFFGCLWWTQFYKYAKKDD